MDLVAVRTCVETELELLGEQTPTMLDRTLKPTPNGCLARTCVVGLPSCLRRSRLILISRQP